MFSKQKFYFAQFQLKVINWNWIALKTNNKTGKQIRNCEATRLFEINKSIVRRWKKDKNSLISSNKNQRAFWKSKVDWIKRIV